MTYGRSRQSPIRSTSVRDGRVHDRLLEIAVADIRPGDGIQAELEEVRRRRGVLAGHVLDGLVAVEEQEPAGLVRKLGAGVLGDRRPHRGRDHHQTVDSIDCSTPASGASQKSALRYFQPPSARIATTTPSSSSAASRRATWIAAPAETPPRIPSSRSSSRTAATDCSFETSTFRSRRLTSRIGGT